MAGPVSSNQPVMPDLADFAFLSVDVYQGSDNRGQSDNGWSRFGRSGDDVTSGLKIQAYQHADIPNHVVIASGGTDFGFNADFLKDLAADVGFIGTPDDLPLQFREALRFAAETISESQALDVRDNSITTFSVTGHSLGGGEAQLISYVFGLGGMSLDAPGAQGLVNSPGFSQYMDQLRAEFPTVVPPASEFGVPPSFINVVENGSLISEIGEHLGTVLPIDASPAQAGEIAGGMAALVPERRNPCIDVAHALNFTLSNLAVDNRFKVNSVLSFYQLPDATIQRALL